MSSTAKIPSLASTSYTLGFYNFFYLLNSLVLLRSISSALYYSLDTYYIFIIYISPYNILSNFLL